MRRYNIFAALILLSLIFRGAVVGAQACPDALPPRLAIGMTAMRLTGLSSYLRETPSLTGFQMGRLRSGEKVAVLDGPVCADNFNWWLVSYQNVTAWTVEADANEYWLIPLAPPPTSSPLPEDAIATPTLTPETVLPTSTPTLESSPQPIDTTVPTAQPTLESQVISTATPSPSPTPTMTLTPISAGLGDEPLIAYVAYSENFTNVGEISVMQPDGGNPRPLITTMWGDAPLWSPDGRRIIFGAALGLTVYDTLTGETIAIAPGMGYAAAAYTWSPDSAQILFETQLPEGGNDEIFIVNADGSGLQNLTNNPAPDKMPAFSPDGATIAFVSIRDGRGVSGLYLMDADGENVRPLAAELNFVQYPTWSPDGAHIALVAGANLVILDVVENEISVVRGVESVYYHPVWSPDGAWIAFIGGDPGTPFNYFVVDQQGENLRQLTISGVYRGGIAAPAWDDAGRVLAQTADGWIYALSPDGLVQKRLLFSPGLAASPTFRFITSS